MTTYARAGGRPAQPDAGPGPGLSREALTAVLGRPLSREQAEVVHAPLAPGVVVAGAGSGKTFTMVARVLWLVGSGQVAPQAVLGLTFTTKAADELAVRVRQGLRRLRSEGLLPGQDLELEPTVSTYHSYAARLVRDHALRVGREPAARLITPATSWQLAARAVHTYDGPMSAVSWTESTVVTAVLALAGDLAEHLAAPSDVLETGSWLRQAAAGAGRLQKAGEDVLEAQQVREQLLPLVARYTAAKRARELLDFGDAVALAAQLARDHPAVRDAERAAYRVVLLDEYQDTGAAQEVLLSCLFGSGHPVTAVGDPCQSIYGWRGASAGTLRRFGERFAVADRRVRHLSTTYRSGGRILQLANALSADLRVEGVPVPRLAAAPGRDSDGEVRCALLTDVTAEAEWVAWQVAAAVHALPPAEAGGHWSRAAVLCRKRAMFPRLRAAFEALDVPVEVVGLGGLLDIPEVADIVATMRVLDDPTADADLLRLLTGPRWRIGPRDLVALGRRARGLVRREADRAAPGDPVEAVVLGVDDTQVGSLADALDDLPPQPDALSVPGRRRLETLRDELAALRRRADQPLPDLVGDIERTLGLDVEVTARPGAGPASAARADLDAFADAAASFAGDAAQDGEGGAVLSAFLAYLAAAEEEEHGLDVGTPGAADTVTLMTVHAAKGLEWPVVAVPGMSRGAKSSVFPGRPRTCTSWTRNARLLPFPLRGDREDLPGLDGLEPGQLAAHKAANDARDAREERRLAYVAVTRAEQVLLCSGYHWGDGVAALGPSEFLLEARAACEQGAGPVVEWVEEPGDGPVGAPGRGVTWPSAGAPAGEAVQAAARRVRELLEARVAPAITTSTVLTTSPVIPTSTTIPTSTAITAVPATPAMDGDLDLSPADRARVEAWDEDLRRLAAEARHRRAARHSAVLPGHLSVSTLVELRRDPAALAGSLQRPVPRRPSPRARRGTAFHQWLEKEVFGQPQLLDPDELPGAADEAAAGDEELARLQAAFRSSAWWGRNPHEIEVPFEMELEGALVRGRMDAVYRTPGPDGDRYDVVDWKTGAPPSGQDRAAADVQLAAYRLAWQQLCGVQLAHVTAAFYYVAYGREVRPAELLDEAGLRDLLRAVPITPCRRAAVTP